MRKGAKFLIGSGLMLALSGPLWGVEKKATVKVYGMTCQMCANGVAGSLKQLKGVKSAEVSVKDGQAVVAYDDQQVTLARIKKQIEKSGFSTEPKGK
jgi:copper chaperone CopZ